MNWRLYLYFFRSTWILSILTGIGISLVLKSLPFPVNMISSIFALIPTGGLLLDLCYKELSYKEEYLFFNNQGISKVRLWGVTFFLSAGSSFILYQIYRLCVQASKWIAS